MRPSAPPMLARLVAIALLTASATAGAASGSLNVQAVLFGSYDALAAQPLDGVGNFERHLRRVQLLFHCARARAGLAARAPPRGSGGQLAYNLYTDVLRLAIRGDGTQGTALVGGSGTSSSFTIYGRVPPRQLVPAGVDGDVVTVTLLI